ncbi:hypothetical protein FM037_15920 [Shewanella psychropiezotolerans]|uniref:Alpha/beta hydrolase n=1 Tax=Shewanella psychropiezotolerans TaxID=2593655 RepID=A0ABX5WZA5_9GAMM|nr:MULTISPECIES: hypothetical protein [Shewanella]MPY24206.1 hypothetical protein [Shewanella sp. YLB-07]QDO84420.1 hypothetical protein FM037_15920 [Shewanella psychropiezotolerans]
MPSYKPLIKPTKTKSLAVSITSIKPVEEPINLNPAFRGTSTVFNVKDTDKLISDIHDGNKKNIYVTKSHTGFRDGESKPAKPPLSEEERNNMTSGGLNRLNKALYSSGNIKFVEGGNSGPEMIETILIHGTFNPDAPLVGWTRPNIDINQRIRTRYGGKITAMQWSGKNHRVARIEAGRALSERISENTSNNIQTNIIAHSHGGNVVFEAIKQNGSGYINHLITLGTPIRKDHLPSLSEIKEGTNAYIHVSGGKDGVAPKGGVDWVTPGRGVFTDKSRYSKAETHNPLSDVEVHIIDANHSELHQRAVLDLFGSKEMKVNRTTKI